MRRRGAVTTTNEMNEINPIICRGRRLDDPNEINENGFETAGVVSLRLGHVRVLTYHRYVIHYPHAASLPPPYTFTLNEMNENHISDRKYAQAEAIITTRIK